MSEEEFETYLRLLGRFLKLSDRQREAIGQELRDHMEERLGELLDSGHTREEAVMTVLDEFGDAAARRRKWIMRTTAGTIGIAAAILFVCFLLPQNRPHVPAPFYSQAEEAALVAESAQCKAKEKTAQIPVFGTPEMDADRKAREMLSAVIPKFEFIDDTALEDIIEFLRVETGASIDVNWTELDILAIDRTTLLDDINLKNVKLETVLEILLIRVAGPDVELGYDVIDGVIRISSMEDLSRTTIIRVYDCQSLIQRSLTVSHMAAIEALVREYTVPPTPGMGGGMMGMGSYGGGGGDDDDDGSNLSAQERIIYNVMVALRDRDAELLSELVKTQVSPGTWDQDGVGSITIFDNFLVIRHTPVVHSKVVKLLDMLSRAKVARGVITQPPTSQPVVRSIPKRDMIYSDY
ncbi:MAG: permease prefix domain 1-containing protein [Planctomycetota bacterium]|jgi:hypothetical protein